MTDMNIAEAIELLESHGFEVTYRTGDDDGSRDLTHIVKNPDPDGLDTPPMYFDTETDGDVLDQSGEVVRDIVTDVLDEANNFRRQNGGEK